jgi:aminoglycoside 3-N-acetyltransferase
LFTQVTKAIQWRTQQLRRRFRETRRNRVRLTEADLRDCLRSFTPSPVGSVMVHSSLSACGSIEGGAGTVVRALREWLDGDTLAMPAHTYCYPEGAAPAPLFDPKATPSVVGAITEQFRQEPGVLRSLHPSHSLAAEGPDAASLIADHDRCETPCGAGSPYERLVQANGGVLMFGARLDAYTLFHTAEDAAGVPYLYYSQPVNLRMRDGAGERTLTSRRQDMTVPRCFAEMDRWLEARGLLTRRRLGLGELLFVPRTGDAHEALVAALRENPLLLVAPSARARLHAAERPSINKMAVR